MADKNTEVWRVILNKVLSVADKNTEVWRVVLAILTLFIMGGMVLLVHVLYDMSQSIEMCPDPKKQAALVKLQSEEQRLAKALADVQNKKWALERDAGVAP